MTEFDIFVNRISIEVKIIFVFTKFFILNSRAYKLLITRVSITYSSFNAFHIRKTLITSRISIDDSCSWKKVPCLFSYLKAKLLFFQLWFERTFLRTMILFTLRCLSMHCNYKCWNSRSLDPLIECIMATRFNIW